MDTIKVCGEMVAPVQLRAFWCLLADMAAMALMLGGAMASLQAQALAPTVDPPFSVLLL